MDNVVIKIIPNGSDVANSGASKRLKLKPTSEANIPNNIKKISSNGAADVTSDISSDTKKEVGLSTTPNSSDSINVSAINSENLILDNTQKKDIEDYRITFPRRSDKPIRLNDSMYDNFRGRSLDSRRNLVINEINSSTSDAVQFVPTENISIPSSVGVSPMIDTASVDTEQVKDAIDDAFSSEFKKVGSSNTKAQIDKYVNDLPSELSPTVGHINDSIFASDNSEVVDNAVVDFETVRDVPIVVAERSNPPIVDSRSFAFESQNEQPEEKSTSDNFTPIINMVAEDNYLNELKKYEESFKDSGAVTDEFSGADIISFEEAKANIEKARERNNIY